MFNLKLFFLYTTISVTLFWITCFSQTQKIEISDSGWRLWCDTSAQWRNDDLFLSDEVDLEKLPVNPPTGGWEILDSKLGISVQLPSTVEQHFWGKFGYRNYNGEYWFEDEDTQVKNGNYLGVSWWWKEIFIPKSFENKIVLLHIRGARLRAEVYLNKVLVGYNIITETSFECDISNAIIPGKKNLLAIRITNPGGRLDWVDTKLMEWGKYKFHMSHGFGGLDRGITITAHAPVYINDMWIANTPQIKKVFVHSAIKNTLKQDIECKIIYQILDKVNKSKILKTVVEFKTIPANSTSKIQTEIELENTKLWSVDNPNLYLLRESIITEHKNKKIIDEKEKTFGFRWFEADGVGQNAVLRLNGDRIRLYSAISWGFWGLNGLFPTKELADKEVKAAKTFGMNCIQFHRNIGKTEVLDAQDRLGLLRYMEPGGGQTALGEKFSMYADSPKERIDVSGQNGEPETFAEKYMEEKIMRMIRDHRSHPSLIIYCVQNEINPDLRNPRIFYLIHKMHDEDPSRIVILKSGIPPINQVWMKPYDSTVFCDTGDGFSGWWDEHTVGGPGIWRDLLYKNPNDFTHRSTNEKEIVTWGEMLGAAVPDNHDLMIRQINSKGGRSYDLEDHREILNAYNNFLNRWNFKSAFKKSENLFNNIGNKCYDFWGRVIETARLAEANDFFVISGWESTAIENHSGLVDNLRNFKGDPTLIRRGLEKLKPVIKTRSLVIEAGQKAILDLYLLNETNIPHPKKLTLTLISPDRTKKKLAELTAPNFEKDKFVYRLADSLITPKLELEGFYTLILSFVDNSKIGCEEKILVINPNKNSELIKKKIGVHSTNPDFQKSLSKLLPNSVIEKYDSEKDYDMLIVSSKLLYGWRSEVDSTTEIQNTDDDFLYRTESWGYWNNLEYVFDNLPKGKAKVTLRFAEITLNGIGERVMNVAINGDTVLKDFDIFKTAGGKNIALDTVFIVDAPDGIVKITVPKLTVNYAKFSAIKVEAGDTIIAINCGGKPYIDKDGLEWKVYSAPISLDQKMISKIKNGTSLIALPEGEDASLAYADTLAKAGAFECSGHVGKTRQSWMGSWFFVKSHPILDGLPVNQAMSSYYQVPIQNNDGILLDGNNVEVFIGYGRDHDRNIGSAGFTAKLHKGKILFFTLPGIISAVSNKQDGIQPVMGKRLLVNSIKYLDN